MQNLLDVWVSVRELSFLKDSLVPLDDLCPFVGVCDYQEVFLRVDFHERVHDKPVCVLCKENALDSFENIFLDVFLWDFSRPEKLP